MSQVTLNQFFNLQIPQQNIELPKREIFTVLPQQPSNELNRLCNLKGKVETFQSMQTRLEDATTHEKRDRTIACIIGAALVGLVAGTVLGFLFCPPVGIVCAALLLVLGFVCSGVTAHIASKDHRDGYEMIKYADMFGIGWPRIIAYLLTRKDAIENNNRIMKQEIANDLLDAGRYFKQNGAAIKETLEHDIELAEHLRMNHFSYDTQAAVQGLSQQIEKSRDLLEELNTKATPLVNALIQAGLLQA